MEGSRDSHIWLDRQADRMEQVLSGLSLAARVCGGKVSEAGIEYRIRPMLGTQPQALLDAAADIAEDIGVRQVRAEYEDEEVALQIPRHATDPLRLLPFMSSLGDLEPLTAVLGRDMDRRPAVIRLGRAPGTHLIVWGAPGTGKSELLRVALVSLALTSDRSQLLLQGIDIGGQQLSALEAFPHARDELATNLGAAEGMIARLEIEARRRHPRGICAPHIALFVDDLAWLCRDRRERALQTLLRLLDRGATSGVHVFAGLRIPAMQRLGPLEAYRRARQIYSLRAINSRGQGGHLFEIEARQPPAAIQTAWMSAQEIDQAVRLMGPWRASHSHKGG
jgi:DNA segregation ATPase FtsK/SpoIIIE-like protein